MKTVDTLIIGGGISGLSCAKRLNEAGIDFLLISKELGGRMKASKSFIANYGAAYVTEDYINVLPLVQKGEEMKVKDFYFFDGKKFSNLFSLRMAKHVWPFLKLIFFAWKIRKHLVRYRGKATSMSMQQVFNEDPFLLKYWLMPASEFIKKYKLEEISHYIVDPVTSATTFVKADSVNTVYFVSMIFPVFLKTWIVDFTHTVEKLTKGYKSKIKIGEVLKVKKQKTGKYQVKTTIGDFHVNNVVFAAAQKHMKSIYPLPDKNIQQDSFVFHVEGERLAKFHGKKAIVFQDKYYDIHMLWRQRDNTDIIYTQNNKPDFKRYYSSYRILKKIYWEPAMIIPNCCIIDQQISDHLYIASDINVSGLEDSFLSGQYVANQIIKQANDVNKKVKDLVCKMAIDKISALSARHKDKDYYFCGKNCKRVFVANPNSYIK